MLRRVGWILLGLVVALLIWGLAEPYFVDVERYEVTIEGLPAAWDGQEIAQISDWHIGMWLDNKSTVERIIDRIIARRPALVLFTGDFVYSPGRPEAQVETVQMLIEPLMEAGLSVYAVLGNHDYGMAHPDGEVDLTLARIVRRQLEAFGVVVLENAARALPTPGRRTGAPDATGVRLYLAGIGPHWPGRDDVSVALAAVPDTAPRLVMMHNPTTFGTVPAGVAPLAMAGHTHGGQVRLPFTPAWSWLIFVKDDEVHADGWVDNYGASGNRLYVNRGIGMNFVPLRINCMPELTLFTLRAAP